MKRRIIVSNRLPFSLTRTEGNYAFEPSSGGLVSAVGGFLEKEKSESGLKSLWVGWPGAPVPSNRRETVRRQALEQHGCWPVFLSAEQIDLFYHGFSNKTLWPLFHYFPSYTVYDASLWDAYVEVNEYFAESLLGLLEEGDVVWIHDYQLMLLPELLRRKRPGLAIGFFLHIPFPSFEIFRMLPTRWREALLKGALGADLVGFHTEDYSRYFVQSVQRTLGHASSRSGIQVGGRHVQVGAFPIGIDAARFVLAAEGPEARQMAAEIRADLGAAMRIIFSVDRLDYSKGILHRLLGFEEFLLRHPEEFGRVIFLLTVVPSREEVPQYRRMKKDLDEVVGRINGRYGNTSWMPILYQYRSLAFDELVACYSVADIALITPIRDGMNLVAKEYVACRLRDDGVLILSETAGAARDLSGALLVNPNHKEELAQALSTALEMEPAEQERRMRPMRQGLHRYDSTWWARTFLENLEALDEARRDRHEMLSRLSAARRRVLLLDYDGTLVPFAPLPGLAVPDEELLRLLGRLAGDPRNRVVIISGRERNSLAQWLGELDVEIVAEHGAWIRDAGPASPWKLLRPVKAGWKQGVRTLLEEYVKRVPGSLLEEKDFSLAWHYRGVDSETGKARAQELTDELIRISQGSGMQILQGNRVVEAREAGVDKGAAARALLSEERSGEEAGVILAVGDDHTDEDLFAALPADALTVRVGPAVSRARFRLRDPLEVRELLQALANASAGEEI